MVIDKKRTAKSESLTIRLDPKTRFVLDFVARLRGQTITTVVERAINEAASAVSLSHDDQRTWRDFWDVSEGVRALQIAGEAALHPTYEEERRLAFVKEHWPFFYTEDDMWVLHRSYIGILWPRIDEFVEMHEAGKAANYFAAGGAMALALLKANISPPAWPVAGQSVSPINSGGFSIAAREDFTADIDDEIPF